MIELDFEFALDASGPRGPYPDFWVEECLVGAFEGLQVIVVNDVDLSGSLPILGFAWTLRVIANLLTQTRIGVQDYRDLSSEWVIDFRADGFEVEISDARGRAKIPLEEFRVAAQQYADRVFEACCKMSPSILENEFIMAWWNDDDYFTKPFEPKKTDRRTLTPLHPFYQKD